MTSSKANGGGIASRLTPIAWGAVVALVIAMAGAPGAIAAEADDAIGSDSITIETSHDGSALAGTDYQLYRVANESKNGTTTPVGAFADTAGYPVDWSQVSAGDESSRDLAATLQDLVSAAGTVPQRRATADAQGEASFDHLADGLYLLTSSKVETAKLDCASSSTLVALPSSGTVTVRTGDLRDVSLSPKIACMARGVMSESLAVRKVWQDGGSAQRPAAVTVALLCDGERV
ncbi:MAG: hypothetical protein U0K19_03870 [Bifidobacteriaceae bacterium]|nr:hypothetical protein [Bifidobacteriaceae bacterium]